MKRMILTTLFLITIVHRPFQCLSRYIVDRFGFCIKGKRPNGLNLVVVKNKMSKKHMIVQPIVSILFLVFVCHASYASSVAKDSLIHALSQERQSSQRCIIYRNLADICFDTPDEITYLRLLIDEATAAGNTHVLLEGIGDIMNAFMINNQLDSAAYYMKRFDAPEKTEAVRSWSAYMEMRMFNVAVVKEDRADVINEVREGLGKQTDEDIYSKIKNAYLVANSLSSQKKHEQALNYAINAEQLAATLPFEKGYRIHLCVMRLLSTIYIHNNLYAEAIGKMEGYIELLEKSYEHFYKADRPYYYINSLRLSAYTTLMINVRALSPEKAEFYFRKVLEFETQAVSLTDKYNCYFILSNYYLAKKDWPRALAVNDSLIKYAEVIAKYNVPGLYKLSSTLYEVMNRDKEALTALKIYFSIQDSLNTAKANEHLNQLQVEYDVNRLNYEKSQLEGKNKQIILFCLVFVLFCLSTLCTYLYNSLRKERAMKIRLSQLKIKAEESEKMKTVFIQSVCHEIRTPLNAIVGFSDLMCMPDIDEDMRKCFPEEIHQNSVLLTSLISQMLKVAELDVSKERLPVEATDIHVVCVQSLERLQDRNKKDVSYILDIPDEPLTMQTNQHYLMLVLENVLDNASKFTDQGQVVLHYKADPQENRLLISVTDTGCGISPDKHEKVFERFSKLDDYKPGNGLGLYLCRLIMSRLDGRIYIDSTYTEGTRICIELPL